MAVSFIPVRDLTKRRYSVAQKVMSEDEAYNRGQFLQERFTNQNSAGDYAQANKIENISITTSNVSVDHKLGRPYNGFNVIKNSTGASVQVVENDANKDVRDRIITLKGSASATITIMVF